MTNHTTSKDGTKIAYDRLGQGPPLVIVNGALSVRSFVFARKAAEELAKRFTVYNYDRRGRGESTDNATYTVQKEVDDVAAMCKAAGGKPFVVGFSSGAALALEAAAAGIPMQALYAYEPPYVKADPNGTIDADYRERLEAYRDSGQRTEAVRYFMRSVGVPGFGIAIMRMLPMWKTMVGVAHTLPYDAAVMDRFTVPAKRLARVSVPTFVANGSKTSSSLKVAAKAVADAVPNARHRIVPNANHGIKPKAIAAELEATLLAA